jgi:hypothetical protein
MFKNTIIAGIGLLMLCGSAFAEFSIYTIDNYFKAVFPGSPQNNGELGTGAQKHRSYSYTDESNLVVYTATYQLGKITFDTSSVSSALRNYVNGQASVIGGHVASYNNRAIQGNKSAIFLINFQFQGMSVRKHGVVSYKDGHFYQWAVQDFPGKSGMDGENIFTSYLDYFTVN